MRIVIVIPTLGIGGAEKIAVNTARILNKDHEIKLVVFERLEKEYELDPQIAVNCLQVPSQGNRLIKVINQLKRIKALRTLRKDFQPDIVYSLTNSANLANVFSGIHCAGKSIVSVRGYRSVGNSWIDRLMYQRADAVVTVSDGLRKKLLSFFPSFHSFFTVYNGYDLEKIQQKAIHKVGQARAGRDQRFTFISVGRLEEVKGHDRLLQAFSIIHKKHPDTQLWLVGDGSRHLELEKLSQNLGLRDAVSFSGEQDNPYGYLSQAAVFVLPSRNEGFPGVLIEAMACGIPVISTDCESGPREILSDDIEKERPAYGTEERSYGILCQCDCDEQAIENLANAMLQIYEEPELREMYQEKAGERARKFSIEAYQNKLLSLFEAVCLSTDSK